LINALCIRKGPLGLIISICFVITFLGCDRDKAQLSTNSPSPADSAQMELLEVLEQESNQIGFAEVYDHVLRPACLQCHNGETAMGGVSFINYTQTLSSGGLDWVKPFYPEESLLFETISLAHGPRQMPPEGEPGLSEEQVELVYRWIVSGARFLGTDQEPHRPPSLQQELEPYFSDPSQIDYPVIKHYVFDQGRCTQCHSSEVDTAEQAAILFGADLTSYASLSFLNAVIPGRLMDQERPSEQGGVYVRPGSQVYQSIISQSMPPQERGFLPLHPLRVELLRLWILNCAVETAGVPLSPEVMIEDLDPLSRIRANCEQRHHLESE
jgi:hypothetical protein